MSCWHGCPGRVAVPSRLPGHLSRARRGLVRPERDGGTAILRGRDQERADTGRGRGKRGQAGSRGRADGGAAGRQVAADPCGRARRHRERSRPGEPFLGWDPSPLHRARGAVPSVRARPPTLGAHPVPLPRMRRVLTPLYQIPVPSILGAHPMCIGCFSSLCQGF